MGYLIPVTPQALVNRISIFGPDETNIKEISYQLSLHLTIPINIFTPPKSLELYIFGQDLLADGEGLGVGRRWTSHFGSPHIAAYVGLNGE